MDNGGGGEGKELQRRGGKRGGGREATVIGVLEWRVYRGIRPNSPTSHSLHCHNSFKVGEKKEKEKREKTHTLRNV